MRATFFCCAILALVCVSSASAAIINADFETGDLSGWTVNYWPGSVSTIAAESDGAGGFRAVLRMTTEVENQEARASMTQVFTISEGSYLSFDYEWDIATGTFGFVIHGYVPGSHGGVLAAVSGIGQTSGSGSGTRTIRLLPGQHTFQLYSSHDYDVGVFDGFLAIDNITLTPIPEPGSIALLFAGLALVTHWGIHRSRSAAKS